MKMDEHKITALPVIDMEDRVLGMLTSERIGPLLRR
jgi:CBS-domain-containing membrane protein